MDHLDPFDRPGPPRGGVRAVLDAADRLAAATNAVAEIRALMDATGLPDTHVWALVRNADLRDILDKHGV